jgi:ribosomal protein S18 acetylase RimI-like enzyme
MRISWRSRAADSFLRRHFTPNCTKRLRGAGCFRQAIAMDDLVFTVRPARHEDAQAVARVYIDSWHDTYPAILPTELLRAMTPRGQTARWRSAIVGSSRERVLVAESLQHGVVGMTSFGPAQDKAMGYDSEVYTLYVAPGFFGCGIGSALLGAGFRALRTSSYTSCVIWAHARNPARYFYETMGGRLVAERVRRMLGTAVPEAAFGWTNLALADKKPAPRGTITRP